ncbi:MAG: hypothetical protein OSJ83_01420 [Clostridia bacterium]|nr:hypothetical protein [Clostridia bacterium]
MNKDYEFIEDEYEEGITFKKVAHFFKKGWLRAIVYVVICLLVALVVALPIRTFYRSEPVAQTTIEFVYDGIEQGLAPDGSILSTDNIITSTVLADAVDRAELGEKINNVSTLRSNMRVEAVETEEYASLVEAAANGDANAIATLRTYVMHPTSFNIVISNPAALGLTDSEAKKLLSCIVNSYYADFLKRYTVQEMFSQDVFALSSDSNIEFVNILDIYETALKDIRASIQKFADSDPDFVSRVSSKSFVTLVSDLILLESKCEQIDGYVSTNNIWADKSVAYDALKVQQEEIGNRIASLKEYVASLNKQIELINQEYQIVADGDKQQIIVGKYPPVYEECHRKLDEANRQIHDYDVRLKNVEMRIAKIDPDKVGENITPTPSTLVEAARKRLAAFEKEASETVAQANTTIADYYTTQYVASSVRQIRQPIVTRIGLDFSMVVVFLAAGAFGFIVSLIVTAIKISYANAARKKKAARDGDAAAVAEAANEKEETAEAKTE